MLDLIGAQWVRKIIDATFHFEMKCETAYERNGFK